MNRIMYQALQQEAVLQQTLEETKDAICQDILDDTSTEGFMLLRSDGPVCVVARFSTVRETGLSAELHIPKAQANAVRRKLAGAKTVTDLVSRLDEMVHTGIARFNGTDTCKLNNKTIEVLRRYL